MREVKKDVFFLHRSLRFCRRNLCLYSRSLRFYHRKLRLNIAKAVGESLFDDDFLSANDVYAFL